LGDVFRSWRGDKLEFVLSKLLTPPEPEAVESAVRHLTQLGALTPAEQELTALGQHLVAMPMDAPLGKALIYGCILRCTSPMLTIAAAAAHGKSVWVSPADKRAEVGGGNARKWGVWRKQRKSGHKQMLRP
jgi:ATP-dependent RNA helicase DHX57